MAGALEANGKSGMSERIAGRKGSQRQGRPDSLFESAGVSQGADKAVMGLNVRRICGDGGAKRMCRSRGRTGCKQFETLLIQRIGAWNLCSDHSVFRINR
jgi:hypothetical protein